MKAKYCKFNMDTACVETILADGTRISVYCPDVEDEIAYAAAQRAELDWLIYNEPLIYVNLILSQEICDYLNGPSLHGLTD